MNVHTAGWPVGRYYRPLVDNRPFCLNGRYFWICGRYYIKMVDILSKFSQNGDMIYLRTWKCITLLPLNGEIWKYTPTSCLTIQGNRTYNSPAKMGEVHRCEIITIVKVYSDSLLGRRTILFSDRDCWVYTLYIIHYTLYIVLTCTH